MLDSNPSISVGGDLHRFRLEQESRSAAAHLALELRQREARAVLQDSLTSQNIGAQIITLPEVREQVRSRKGIVDAFVKTCQRWELDSDGQMILLGYRPNDATGRRVLAGQWIPSSQDFL